jgi:hypothetical protein
MSDWGVPQSHLRRGRGPATRASHPSAPPRPMLALPCGGRCPGVVYHCRDTGLEGRDNIVGLGISKGTLWDVTPSKQALIAIRANCNRMEPADSVRIGLESRETIKPLSAFSEDVTDQASSPKFCQEGFHHRLDFWVVLVHKHCRPPIIWRGWQLGQHWRLFPRAGRANRDTRRELIGTPPPLCPGNT